MASVGPQIYPRRSPHHHRFQVPVPFLPLPLALTLHADVTLPPHVFRFNGCWSSFRSLLFAFRRFRSFPRSLPSRFPRTGHPLTLHARLSMRMPFQLGHFVYPACQDITHRRQFAISFSHRSECFFIALHCFRVPSLRLRGSLPWGSRTCVSKGVKGKSRRRYIRTNILHPHPPSPPPTSPLYPACSPVASPTDCLPSCCGLLIYTAVSEQLLRS